MVTLHSFLAILSGFATIVLLGLVFAAFLQWAAPAWAGAKDRLQPSYVLVNLLFSLLTAVLGGYITASMGDLNPLSNVLALGIVVLVLGAINVLQSRGGPQPIWYHIVVLVLSTVGVFLGGLLRLKLLGLL